MNQLTTIVQYYVNNEETKEFKQEVTSFSSTDNNTKENISKENNLSSSIFNVNHNYAPMSAWSTFNTNCAESKCCSESKTKAKKKEENKPAYLIGIILVGTTAVVGYFLGGSLIKYRRVNADMKECETLLDEIRDNRDNSVGNNVIRDNVIRDNAGQDLKLVKQAKTVISSFYNNRLWSLLNQIGLLGGSLMMATSCFVPTFAVLFPLGLAVGSCCVVSGGIRCGIWKQTVKSHQLKLLSIITAISSFRPPAYNSDSN